MSPGIQGIEQVTPASQPVSTPSRTHSSPRGSWGDKRDRGMTSEASATGCVVSLSPVHGNLLNQGGRAKDAVISCRCWGHLAPRSSPQIHPRTRLAISSSMGTRPWVQLLAASSLLFRMEELPTVASSYSILRERRKAKTEELISFPERAQDTPSFAGTLYGVMA